MKNWQFKEDAHHYLRRASIGLFLISLVTVGIVESEGREYGLELLVNGPLAVLLGVYAWFANPLYGLSLLISKKWPLVAICLILAALILGASSINLKVVPYSAERVGKVLGFGLGYYLWLASFAVALFASLSQALKSKP